MAFVFSATVNHPRTSARFEPPPTYNSLMIPKLRFSASHERESEELAEDLKLRLHLDSLPVPQSVRLNEYSIPSDGIRWDVFDKSISKLLGEEAYLWNTYSRPEEGWYTMYAPRPLTTSQINDLKAWTSEANEEDRISTENARSRGKADEEYRAQERELIRQERAEREARDQERWRREKRRRELEREIAWEERKREEWRKYYRQRAVADEEIRRTERLEERLIMMENVMMEGDKATNAEDDDEIPDESAWRKASMQRRINESGRCRWKQDHYSTGKDLTKKRNSRKAFTSHANGLHKPLSFRDQLINLEWEVLRRVAPTNYTLDH